MSGKVQGAKVIRSLLNKVFGRGISIPLLSVRWGGEEGLVVSQVQVIKKILGLFRRKSYNGDRRKA